jgi:hypothetical protein
VKVKKFKIPLFFWLHVKEKSNNLAKKNCKNMVTKKPKKTHFSLFWKKIVKLLNLVKKKCWDTTCTFSSQIVPYSMWHVGWGLNLTFDLYHYQKNYHFQPIFATKKCYLQLKLKSSHNQLFLVTKIDYKTTISFVLYCHGVCLNSLCKRTCLFVENYINSCW